MHKTSRAIILGELLHNAADKGDLMHLNRLYKAIDKAQVVSFDVFDTLLLRPYLAPSDMFTHLERVHKRFGFAQRRLRAPRIFYLKHGREREANLDDIYDQLPDFADMKQAELDWEWQTIRANAEMKPLFDYALSAGKSVIICSDMYLPSEFIGRLLVHNGFAGYAKLFVSAYAGASKARRARGGGRRSLWDVVLEELKVPPASILHIGDNKGSDYTQARRHGLTAFWYETRFSRAIKANKQFRTLIHARGGSLGLSVCAALSLQRQRTSDYWVEFGYRYAGPIVYAFSRYIYKIAQDVRLDKILFVARDGYLPQKVFATFESTIPTAYVYAPHFLAWTAYLFYDGTRNEAANEAYARRVCEHFNKDYSPYLSAHDCIDCNADEFKRLAEGERRKARFAQYIQAIVGDAKAVGVVVDNSARYTAQRMIEAECNVATVGFYTIASANANPCKSFAYFSEDHKNIPSAYNRIIEFTLSAPEPTAKTLAGGKVVYREVAAAEQKAIEVAKGIEAGVVQFAADVKALFAGSDIYLTKADVATLSDVFIARPTREDMAAWWDVRETDAGSRPRYTPVLTGRVPFWQVGQLKRLAWRTPAQKVYLALLSPIILAKRALKRLLGARWGRIRSRLERIARRIAHRIPR